MTNEELYEEYRNGNKLALDELYSQNTKYIQRLADIIAWRYASFFPCSDSADELFQVASFEFVQRIKSGNYDPQKAKLRTYVTPHMKYAMLEHIGMDRIGKNGKIFKLYKFRTMTDSRDAQGNLLSDEERTQDIRIG